LSVADTAFDDPPIQHVHDKEAVLPDGQGGDQAEGQLGVRESAGRAAAVEVAVRVEFAHQFARVTADDLNAVLAS